MSFYGKRKSRDYLSDDEPTDNNNKMPNLNFFQSEIVKSDKVAQPGDDLYSAKKLAEGEEPEKGSIACYIRSEGSGILEKLLETMKEVKNAAERAQLEANSANIKAQRAEVEAAEAINRALRVEVEAAEAMNRALRAEAEAAEAKADTNAHKTAIQDLIAVSLKNDVVQLVYGLADQKLYNLIDDKLLIKNFRSLKFKEVLDVVDPATRLRIDSDRVCAKLKFLITQDQRFRSLVTARNEDSHPNRIEFNSILVKIKTLRSTNQLSTTNEEFANLCENISLELKTLMDAEFLPLINDFNKRKKK